MVSEKLISAFKTKIEAANTISIVPHLNPDGDAMGSALGLMHALKNLGKKPSVIVPTAFPKFLSWLNGVNEIVVFEENEDQAKSTITESDLLIYLDFNAYKRVGETMEGFIANLQLPSVMIDHHPYPDEIADVMISVTAASSTCELACNVLKLSGWSQYIDSDAAECFYTGIMTDTGSLNYNSSNPDTYRTVADLIEIGIDKDKVHQLLFQSNSFNRMRLLGYVLSEKVTLIPECKVAYLWLTKEELEKYNFQPGDTEGFVNYPLSIEGINASAFFMEKDEQIKCSFRSQGDFPVNKFSELFFNGGGHRNAAGGRSDFDMEGSLKRFLSEFPKFYQDFIKA